MVMILMKMMILIKAMMQMMMKRLKLYTLEVEKLNERKTEMSKIRFKKSLKISKSLCHEWVSGFFPNFYPRAQKYYEIFVGKYFNNPR